MDSMEEKVILASDQIATIEQWLARVKDSIEAENVSLWDVWTVQNVYNNVKEEI